MKTKPHIVGAVCVAVGVFAVVCAPLSAQLMPRKRASLSPTPTASPAASPAKQAARPVPFHGMISAVDQSAKTFTMAGKEKSRVFKVTDKTVITKAGKAASMKDITENEEVSGSYWTNADGTLEAKKVKLGPMEKAKTPAASPASSSTATASPKQ